jgi:hypothetical protein
MLTPQRIRLLLAVSVSSLVGVLVATSGSRGQNKTPQAKQVVVLRKKGQKNLPPTAAEIAAFKSQMTKEERKLENKVPQHVPIKIKLRAEKESKFKDIDNAEWDRDFELEVTNTSDKPIYFLDLWLIYSGITTPGGGRVGAVLRFGRPDFIHFDTRPLPTDTPILPGATIILTIPEDTQRGWAQHKKRTNTTDPKKVEIEFTQLSFGDGSGFNSSDAMPYPYKRH